MRLPSVWRATTSSGWEDGNIIVGEYKNIIFIPFDHRYYKINYFIFIYCCFPLEAAAKYFVRIVQEI